MRPGRSTFTAWPRRRWIRFVGGVAWIVSVPIWMSQMVLQILFPIGSWLYDWHVYVAGAHQLLDRTLYTENLVSHYPLPIDTFNYPPLSALIVSPLIGLADQGAGIIWILVNIVAVAIACIVVMKALKVEHPWALAGFLFLLYSAHPWAWLAILGNNTPLVLLLVAAFVHQHEFGHSRFAGVFLGLAIAMKLWPVTMLPTLVRERMWTTLAVAVAIAAATGVASILWLGPESVGPALSALQVLDQVNPGNPVLGPTWLRETFAWWPAWGGAAIAAMLLAIPARGRLGLGLGVLAGMAAIPNLWMHYLPTIVVGGILVYAGLRSEGPSGRLESRAMPSAVLRVPPPGSHSPPPSIGSV